ncbi:hypothetical protein Scep_020669 [Stephania cephalantha]|uniref:DUF7086 domain-containing protein n=1 Tax=Stephania cephalantha TaxID=152367 RepID=A0AAP0ID93_9MAGN
MEEFDDERLALRLSPPVPKAQPPPLPAPQPTPAMSGPVPPQHYQLLLPQQQLVQPHPLLMLPTYNHGNNMHDDELPQVPQHPRIPQRARRLPAHGQIKEEEVLEAPFVWATNKHAGIHSMDHLLANGIDTIYGEVQCKKCNHVSQIGFDLQRKFAEIGNYIKVNQQWMHDRAPEYWMNPELPTCSNCKEPNSMKPVIPNNKHEINWLFLFLGQMLGCCTLDQLKYFCKYTQNHRTGAKDRVLYLTYLSLCKQLDHV